SLLTCGLRSEGGRSPSRPRQPRPHEEDKGMRLGKRSTEAAWAACMEPGNLLPFLRRKLGPRATDRRLLLFSCACGRSVSHLGHDPRWQAAIEAVEQFLEGRVGLPQVTAALADAEAAVGQAEGDGASYARQAATYAASVVARRGPAATTPTTPPVTPST